MPSKAAMYSNLNPPGSLIDPLRHLAEPPFLYLAIIALVLLGILILFVRYRRLHQGIVPFQSSGGTIEVAPQTLRGVMQQAVLGVEGVEKATCRPLPKGNSLGVRVSVHLHVQSRLRDVENQIQQRLRDTLADQFGIESVQPVHIRVTKVIGDPLAPAGSPASLTTRDTGSSQDTSPNPSPQDLSPQETTTKEPEQDSDQSDPTNQGNDPEQPPRDPRS